MSVVLAGDACVQGERGATDSCRSGACLQCAGVSGRYDQGATTKVLRPQDNRRSSSAMFCCQRRMALVNSRG